MYAHTEMDLAPRTSNWLHMQSTQNIDAFIDINHEHARVTEVVTALVRHTRSPVQDGSQLAPLNDWCGATVVGRWGTVTGATHGSRARVGIATCRRVYRCARWLT
jgi:hypothetical protein